MTVYGKKKESSGSKSSSVSTSNNSGPTSTITSEPDSNSAAQNEPHLPPFEVQAENISLRPLSSSGMWSHSQSIGLNLSATSDLRKSNSYLIDSKVTHGGKRRHANSLRVRGKMSRVEKESRGGGGGGDGGGVGVGGGGGGISSLSTCSPVLPILPLTPDPQLPSPLLPNSAHVPSPEVKNCNSEDEYESRAILSEEEWIEREKRFEKKVRKKGLIIKKMGEDGACLFRAVSDQVYGDQDMHETVRRHCMDYIAANGDYFSQYVTEDFEQYVSRKRLDHVHGNHIEIQAMSEMYNRTIEVFCYSNEPINTFHGAHQTDNAPIRLSYHRGVHYNSLVDPYKATIGVGLGLPGNHPGLADKNILSEGARQSEEFHIEQAMLEDKLRATDWEATNEAIEEQVARESYLQWLKDNERRNRATFSASSSSATVTMSSSSSEMRSPRGRHGGGGGGGGGSMSPHRTNASCGGGGGGGARFSPPPSLPGPSTKVGGGVNNSSSTPPPPQSSTSSSSSSSTLFSSSSSSSTTSTNSHSSISTPPPLPPLSSSPPPSQLFLHHHHHSPLYDLNEWDDAKILAQVLAASQQEYFDNMKRCREGGNNSSTNQTPQHPPPSSSSTSPSSD